MASNEPTTTTHVDSERDGNNAGSTTYKLQLDQAAKAASAKPAAKPGDTHHPIVETVAQYAPAAVGKLLGAGSKGGDGEVKTPAPAPGPDGMPGPPERPTHDAQIEEFVRDQHRSKTDALLEDKVQRSVEGGGSSLERVPENKHGVLGGRSRMLRRRL